MVSKGETRVFNSLKTFILSLEIPNSSQVSLIAVFSKFLSSFSYFPPGKDTSPPCLIFLALF